MLIRTGVGEAYYFAPNTKECGFNTHGARARLAFDGAHTGLARSLEALDHSASTV